MDILTYPERLSSQMALAPGPAASVWPLPQSGPARARPRGGNPPGPCLPRPRPTLTPAPPGRACPGRAPTPAAFALLLPHPGAARAPACPDRAARSPRPAAQLRRPWSPVGQPNPGRTRPCHDRGGETGAGGPESAGPGGEGLTGERGTRRRWRTGERRAGWWGGGRE